MFHFEKRDEGLLAIREDGRAVANIDTRTIGWTNNPKLKEQERVDTILPKAKWRYHFTAFKLEHAELEQLVLEAGQQEA
jgi:hypothetical protein